MGIIFNKIFNTECTFANILQSSSVGTPFGHSLLSAAKNKDIFTDFKKGKLVIVTHQAKNFVLIDPLQT